MASGSLNLKLESTLKVYAFTPLSLSAFLLHPPLGMSSVYPPYPRKLSGYLSFRSCARVYFFVTGFQRDKKVSDVRMMRYNQGQTRGIVLFEGNLNLVGRDFGTWCQVVLKCCWCKCDSGLWWTL